MDPIKQATVICLLTIAALVAVIGAARAEEVIVDKIHESFKLCKLANGIVLAELRGKGLEGEVLVDAGTSYIAKVTANGNSGLLTCEGGHQVVTIFIR